MFAPAGRRAARQEVGTMDVSKFKPSDWMKVGGGVGILIFGFLDWVKVDADGFGGGSGGNVFDFFWTGVIPWILVIATAVITVLLVNGTLKAGGPPWPLIMLVATAVAAVLLVLRFVFNPIEGKSELEDLGIDVSRGLGLILSVVSGLVAFAGSIMGFKEAGGDLKDLTDVNKLKSAFDKGETPPPPPPA
jgi:hypothetical protein